MSEAEPGELEGLRALARSLVHALEEPPWPPLVRATVKTKTSMALVAVSILLLGAIAVVGVVWWTRGRPAPEPAALPPARTAPSVPQLATPRSPAVIAPPRH